MKWVNALEEFPSTIDFGRKLPVRVRGGFGDTKFTELKKTGFDIISIAGKVFHKGDERLSQIDWLKDEIGD